jgi:hypothetical protein
MLTFAGMAFRYRMEFYPLLEFTAFLGFYAIGVNPGRFAALSRSTLSLILIVGAGLGIVCSHLFVFLYKLSPVVITISVPDGWVNLYFSQLRVLFPNIAQRLHL